MAKHSDDVANKRWDHRFKLAHRLCDEYDVLYFEDLNLHGMKRLWGRKVSDLGFGSFMSILEWVAFKRGQRHSLTLRDRVLNCDCGLVIDRDHNAAINIQTVGASTVYQSGNKTKVRLRSRIDGRSPSL